MPRLYALSGPDLGRSFAVQSGSVLGRAPECAAILRDASVSRRHARLVLEGGRWVLIDEGSRNGLWQGGEKKPRIELADLAEFKLGEVLLRFRDEPAGAPQVELEEPPPAPAPRAPAREELDEIVLEEAPEPARPAVSAPQRPLEPTVVALRPTLASQPPSPVRPASAQGFAQRSDRVLQYHKQADARGFLSSDLEQRPLWVRALVFVLVLAVFAGVVWLAFRATAFFKARVAGEPPVEETLEEPR